MRREIEKLLRALKLTLFRYLILSVCLSFIGKSLSKFFGSSYFSLFANVICVSVCIRLLKENFWDKFPSLLRRPTKKIKNKIINLWKLFFFCSTNYRHFLTVSAIHVSSLAVDVIQSKDNWFSFSFFVFIRDSYLLIELTPTSVFGPLRWTWTFCHFPSRFCQTRVSSDWWELAAPCLIFYKRWKIVKIFFFM